MSERSSSLVRPQQARSRQTLRRILDAFESALQERTFEEITVSEVCARAACSVGTFYGRVESKDALLEHLRERVYAEMSHALLELFDPERASSMTLETLLGLQCTAMVDVHIRRRGVIRAVVIEARRRSEFASQTQSFNATMLRQISAAWLVHREEIVAKSPALAVGQAALMAAGYLRESIAFGELWPITGPLEARQHAEMLLEMLVAFLLGRRPGQGAS